MKNLIFVALLVSIMLVLAVGQHPQTLQLVKVTLDMTMLKMRKAQPFPALRSAAALAGQAVWLLRRKIVRLPDSQMNLFVFDWTNQ